MRERVGIAVGVSSSDNCYTKVLIEKLGFLMSKDVREVVLDTCIAFEDWELVETFVVNRLVKHSSYSNLIVKLVGKKRSDLLCLCIQQAPDFGPPGLHCLLKYFLCPSKKADASIANVRKGWEGQALVAIEKAKEAAILLMIAHDGFSVRELCLHYLLASPNLDESILSSALSKLNHEEMISLIRYLGEWLKKYERFPHAVSCPNASTVLGLKACDRVPKLDDVVRYVGLMLDENFSSLVLHPDFHEELKSMEGLVSSLALESKLCCYVANIAENLRTEDLRCFKIDYLIAPCFLWFITMATIRTSLDSNIFKKNSICSSKLLQNHERRNDQFESNSHRYLHFWFLHVDMFIFSDLSSYYTNFLSNQIELKPSS